MNTTLTVFEIRQHIFTLADEGYKDFHSKLIPNIDTKTVIGVRTPALRKFANEVYKSGSADCFMSDLPHLYYEENNLHAFLIQKQGDFDECISLLEKFLPYIDNWATCDCLRPQILKTQPKKLLEKIYEWLESEHTYTVRIAIGFLLSFYLDENFDDAQLEKVSKIQSDEYYINMMIAWYFATALAKQYDSTIIYLEDKRLPLWVHRKTIQKARESFRISSDCKAYLKTLIYPKT